MPVRYPIWSSQAACEGLGGGIRPILQMRKQEAQAGEATAQITQKFREETEHLEPSSPALWPSHPLPAHLSPRGSCGMEVGGNL